MNLKNQLSLIKRIGRSIIYWSVCVTHNLWGAYEGNTRSEMCKVQGSMSRSNVYLDPNSRIQFQFYIFLQRFYFESPKYNSIVVVSAFDM
jgi:hypothetical protein